MLRRRRKERPVRRRACLELERNVGGPLWQLVVLGLITSALLKEPFFLGLTFCMAAFLGVAWLWDHFSLTGVRYRRKFSEVRAFQGETVILTLEVGNQKWLPVSWLEVGDIFPGELPVAGERVIISSSTNQVEFTTFWHPAAYQSLTRVMEVPCMQRGYHFYGPATVRTGDGFGFFSRKLTLPERDLLIVYPRLYSATELDLPSKNPFGERRTLFKLFEDPLRPAGIRDWQFGDGMRRVHWKATARYERLLSRIYEPSEEPQVMILLNVSTLPRYWEGIVRELFERTVSVAGSLAALAIEERLSVGLAANAYWPGSDQRLELFPGRRQEQLLHILELLAAVTPYASESFESVLLQVAPRLPWGATLLVVSAVATPELWETLVDLDRAGRQVTLFTLVETPPEFPPIGIPVYHLPQLIDDLVIPQKVAE